MTSSPESVTPHESVETPTQIAKGKFMADAEGQAALRDIKELFGPLRSARVRADDGGRRDEDAELRHEAGCSNCGSWRSGALYAAVRPGIRLCAKCFKAQERRP